MNRTLAAAILLAGTTFSSDEAFAKKPATIIDLSAAADGSCVAHIGSDSAAVVDEALQARLPIIVPDRKADIRFGAGAYEGVPYRCVGLMIFTLQRLGYKNITFAAEPPPSKIDIPVQDNSGQ